MVKGLSLFLLFFVFSAFATTPQRLILKNQQGEQSNNYVIGTYLPFPGTTYNLVSFSGATTPTNGGSGTGHGVAGKGSFYTARDTGALYINTGTLSSPTWTSAGTATNAAIIASTLTAFAATTGTITSADSVLTAIQKLAAGSLTPSTETVSAAGAVSTTKTETTVNNATGSSFAVTLAAPSSQDGQFKIIKLGTATHGATLAMTNIVTSGVYTPTGTTTLTFTSTGDSAVFIAVGTTWVYLGGSAVAS